MAISIDAAHCPQNHPCPSVNVCPLQALTQKGFAAPTVDNALCIDCGKCIRFCPHGVFSKAG